MKAADLFARIQTILDFDELVQTNFENYARRQFLQTLSLRGNQYFSGFGAGGDDGQMQRFQVALQGRLTTDFNRPVSESALDQRHREAVDLQIQLAYLDWRPLPSLNLRGGRQVVYGPLTPMDMDGAMLAFESAVGVRGNVAVGRDVQYDYLGLDGALFEPSGPRLDYFGERRPDSGWLSQLSLGYATPTVEVQIGHRVRQRSGRLSGQRTGATLRAHLGLVTPRLWAEFDHLSGRPVRLEASATFRLSDAVGADLGWYLRRPEFDLDSLFQAYDINPTVTWRMGASWRFDIGLHLQVTARARGFGIDGEVPWAGLVSGHEHTLGGELSGQWHHNPAWRFRLAVNGDVGYGGDAVGSNLSSRWEATDWLELGVQARHLYRQNDAPQQSGHLISARGQSGFELTTFGTAWLWLEYLSDHRLGQGVRGFLMLEFDLGPI